MSKEFLQRAFLVVVASIATLFLGDRGMCVAASDLQGVVPKEAWGEIIDGVQLGICLKKDRFPVCEPVHLVIMLKNVGKDPVKYAETYPEQDYSLLVTDKNGKVVPLTRYGARLSKNVGEVLRRVVKTLGPNGEARVELLVNRLYDMTEAGAYSITVTRPIAKKDGNGVVVVQSGTLNVQVLEGP